MRPLAASPPGAPFKISAGPFGTQLESKVRCSKTSSRSPPRLDKRFRLLVEDWGPRPGVANRAQVRTQTMDRDKITEILLCFEASTASLPSERDHHKK